jgi:hypothetical protein
VSGLCGGDRGASRRCAATGVPGMAASLSPLISSLTQSSAPFNPASCARTTPSAHFQKTRLLFAWRSGSLRCWERASRSGWRGRPPSRPADRSPSRGTAREVGSLEAEFSSLSPLSSCLFCSMDGESCLALLCVDGSLELLSGQRWSDRRAVPLSFPVSSLLALPSGLLLHAMDSLFFLSSPLEAVSPVARVSQRGRGESLSRAWRPVTSGGSLLLLFDSDRRRLALFSCLLASEAPAQSYAAALEQSMSVTMTLTMTADISRLDSFAVISPQKTEPKLFLRRLWTEPAASAPDCAIVSRNQQYLFLRSAATLRCIARDGSGWRESFVSENVSSNCAFGNGKMWLCARGGALVVCDGEREVAQVELDESDDSENRWRKERAAPAENVSENRWQNMDESGSSMDCSPPVPLGASLAIRLREVAFDKCFFALCGSEGAARCALQLSANDLRISRLLEQCAAELGNGLLVDFGEMGLRHAQLSEWERLAALLCCISGKSKSGGVMITPTSWQRLLGRSDAVALLSKRFRKEHHASSFLQHGTGAVPAWYEAGLAFEPRAFSPTFFGNVGLGVLARLHAAYEAAKGDEQQGALGKLPKTVGEIMLIIFFRQSVAPSLAAACS